MKRLSLAALPLVVSLVGCTGTVTHETTPISPSATLEEGARLAIEESTPRLPPLPAYRLYPLEAINTPIMENMKKDGLHDYKTSGWRTLRLDGQKLVAIEGDTVNTALSWGTGVEGAIVKGQLITKNVPSSVTVTGPDSMDVNYSIGSFHVKLVAYDLSGRPMQPYLLTESGGISLISYFMRQDATFPPGSMAYRAEITPSTDVLLAPSVNGFTGAQSIEAFSTRFLGKTPFCLRHNARLIETPMGLVFESAIQKKVQGKGRKAQEVAQQGSALLFPTQKDNLFCQKDSPTAIGQASWDLGYTQGTRGLTFTMPAHIKSVNYGIQEENRTALFPAFAEIKEGKTSKVVPALLWKAKQSVTDPTLRFNGVAATALKTAIQEATPAYEAWEKSSRKDSIAERALAIKAKKGR